MGAGMSKYGQRDQSLKKNNRVRRNAEERSERQSEDGSN
jgi:hypothetical protein